MPIFPDVAYRIICTDFPSGNFSCSISKLIYLSIPYKRYWKIRETFAKDRFATENGAIIEEVREHYARCSIELTERHFNAAGGVMGGVHFVLADFTFAVATNWNGMGVVSLSSTISYLGAVKGKKLIAEAECVKEGRSTVYYRVNVTDDLGNRIAEVGINGFHVYSQA